MGTEPGAMGVAEHDRLMKIVIVGDSGVGKSSCLFRYADDYYDDARTLSTIGVDFRIVHRTVQDRLIKVQLWDTAGQERFRTIAASYYRGADALILVYDATSMNSVTNLARTWMEEITRHSSGTILNSGNVMVLGNKLDAASKLPPNQVNEIKEAAQRFADTVGARLEECSALTSEGINSAFNQSIPRNQTMVDLLFSELDKLLWQSVFRLIADNSNAALNSGEIFSAKDR